MCYTSQSYGSSNSHLWMWELDYKEGWVLKNWCFWTVVLEKTLQSPLDCKEIQPVHPKGDQSWVFVGRTDVEAETPILWPPDAKRWVIWKDPDAGKDWGQEEKGMTEDGMVDGITDAMGISSVQSLSHVRFFATPWIAACQASLSVTNSRSSLKVTSIESVMDHWKNHGLD